jgi:HD superfamily phosphohydrolase
MMNKHELKLKDYLLFDNKVFRDAIHGYIHVELLPIWNLINTKEMQRLRRIKQLGGTSMVFQSAEHSRFTHSLGVYEIVRQIISLDQVKDHLDDYEKLCVMCAGLLHDVGHGPFSHSFESVLPCSHEEMSVRIILEDSEVHEVLEKVHEDLPKDVAAIIQKTARPLLVQLVSSQLDCDRMDYLLRDSYCCGVTYGNFDISRIERTMRIKDEHMVIKASGVQAIEDYILARYHMYWQIYYHPVCRSYEHLLQSILTRVKDLYQEGYGFKTSISLLVPLLENRLSVHDYVALDEPVMMYYFRMFCEEEDPILKDLSERILKRRLFKYKTLESHAALRRVQEISDAYGFDHRYYVTSDYAKNVPYKHYDISNQTAEIEILQEDGSIVSLPETSEIVQAIIHAKEKEDAKVFFVKEIKNEL